MARLSDAQLAGLLDEIAVAMKAKMPISAALERLRDRRLGAVAIAAGSLADAINRGQPLSEAIGACDSPAADQAAAVIRTSERTGDPALLMRFASLLRWRTEYFRGTRISWLYPLTLLIIAYATAVVVMAPLLRQYAGRDFAWPAPLLNLSRWLEHNWMIPPIILVVVVAVWMIWKYTQRPLPADARRRLFCQSLIDQIGADVPESEAIQNAAQLAGEQALSERENLTFESPEVADLVSPAQSPLLEIPGASKQETLIARLKYLAAIYDERARRHEYFWSRLLPRGAMVVIGGGWTLAYAWWVIAPVYFQVGKW